MTIWPPPTTAITDGVGVLTEPAAVDGVDVVVGVEGFAVNVEADDVLGDGVAAFPD